ncbi:hypothetical protein ACFFRR_010025 [Megaselia abdita]
MSPLLTILLTLVITVGLYIYKKFARTLQLSKNFKGAPTLPIVGHGHYLVGKKPHEYISLIEEWVQKYGDVIKVWIGPEFNILTSDLKDVELILGGTKFNDKAEEYKALEPWLNEGLLVSKGRKWFKRRKIITPAFHFKILEQYIETFENQGKTLVRNLNEMVKLGKPFEFYNLINFYTLDVICESAMGVQMNSQSNSDIQYVSAVKTISTVLHKRMFDIVYRYDLTYQFTSLAKEEQKALSILHGFTDSIIKSRRDELVKKGTQSQEEVDEFGTKKKMAFLDLLLQSEIDGKPLTDSDIREEVDTFVFEGHDTTSSAVMFFFYNVATYPETQKKCFEEILEVFGTDKNAPIRHEDLNKLHYIDLCVKETLRMFPSVPILGRKVNEECELNGKIIPAGTNLGISPLYLGRLESLFPEADKFKPERFDVVTSAEKMNPFAYIPFSAGPRNCIGQKFAMLSIKSVVVSVLRNFEVEFCPDTSNEPALIAELILRTKDPLMFKVKPRVYP